MFCGHWLEERGEIERLSLDGCLIEEALGPRKVLIYSVDRLVRHLSELAFRSIIGLLLMLQRTEGSGLFLHTVSGEHRQGPHFWILRLVMELSFWVSREGNHSLGIIVFCWFWWLLSHRSCIAQRVSLAFKHGVQHVANTARLKARSVAVISALPSRRPHSNVAPCLIWISIDCLGVHFNALFPCSHLWPS